MPIITGTPNNDFINGTESPETIDGLGGDDAILAAGGDDIVSGGDGNDQIYGGTGNDYLNGGNGDDLLAGGIGADALDGGDGIDVAFYGDAGFQSVSVNIGSAGQAASGGPQLQANSSLEDDGSRDSLVGIEFVTTGAGDDVILGNDGANTLDAGPGIDILDGRGGDDVLIGGSGPDTLSGGAGNDIFSGTIDDFWGDVITDFQPGEKIHVSDMFMDNFQASVSGNRLIFRNGGYITFANLHALAFTYEHSPNGGVLITINSTSIDGSAGNDILNGTENADVIYGLGGNDTLNGLGGNDLLNGGAGDDVINGGTGVDTATYIDAPSGVSVSLATSTAQNTGGAGFDTLTSVENLVGSKFGDTLTGDTGANVFVGDAGNDVINGGGGVDTVDYSQELGDRRVFVNLSTTSLTVFGAVLAPGHAFDTYGDNDTLVSIENVITGNGDDYVYGSDGDERIETGAGVDLLVGNGGADIMLGGAGNDAYYFSPSEGDQVVELPGGGDDELYLLDRTFSMVGYENFEFLYGTLASGHVFTGNALDNTLIGYTGADAISGGAGDDGIYGSSGDDILFGGDGNDTVSGNSGADTISGDDGNDTLTGGAGADIQTGGAGNDRFQDSLANLNGDTITDFSVGDRLVFNNASLSSFTFSLSGSTLTYSGGSLTLTGGVAGTLIASASPGGGVLLTIAATPDVANDFNGDGRSDILWRNVTTGQFSDWLGQANGGFVGNDANAFASVPTSWSIVGTGDFNGDGRDDVLWRNANGQLSDWLGNASGGFTPNDANALTSVPTSWSVAGTGDFNGDGRDDILWRNSNGQLSDWLGQANGGFVGNDANAFTSVPTNWHVAGTGDFNGDGRDDILWRNDAGQLSDWLGNANGGFTPNDANAFASAPTSWHIVGTGDFNGDGRDDILWRSDSGQLSDWLGQANGGFVGNDANAFTTVPTSWSVVAVGDYNGDGRDDILWRNANGQLSDWLGNANGGFTPNDTNALTSVPTSWHVQVEMAMI